MLRCELSKPGIPVEWRKGEELLKNGVRFQIRRRETTLELLIWKPMPEDSGVYSCVCADQKTSAAVKITGEDDMMSLAPSLSDLSKNWQLLHLCLKYLYIKIFLLNNYVL